MTSEAVRVGVNSYGVIGKRVADAITLQDDMELVGVADVGFDYRVMSAVERGYPVYAARADPGPDMEAAGIPLSSSPSRPAPEPTTGDSATCRRSKGCPAKMPKAMVAFVRESNESTASSPARLEECGDDVSSRPALSQWACPGSFVIPSWIELRSVSTSA
jgi:hypothetical protein